MNYADFGLGTFQPTNGFYDLVTAMVSLGTSLGVSYKTNHDLQKIEIKNKNVSNLIFENSEVKCDLVISGADYHHTESLLPKGLDNIQRIIGKIEFLHPPHFYFMLVLTKN